MQVTTFPFIKRKDFTDIEVVNGLQRQDRKMEEWFYKSAKRYFEAHFNEVFFDKDRKQEVFQTAFLKLWTEIQNAKITLQNGTICRQQHNGEYQPMTCRLTTFLMTFAKNEYREMVRTEHLVFADDWIDKSDVASVSVVTFYGEEDVEVQKNRIVDDCLQMMSPRCMELLTWFYYENKSLDEIMNLRKDSTYSKDGLKTAKNKCMTKLRSKVMEECKRLAI